ncbi:FkbM family methyltransferase [Roseiflexus sp. RS-1]|uniref:FkbM family methyltransferase n=1 Tax=Roseiflexus sp. (strain RS-1) TaxID=357808 RepID=UPI0003166814|nr:FkbM family methyltransferase [Roseiflexus sp. RS-1]
MKSPLNFGDTFQRLKIAISILFQSQSEKADMSDVYFCYRLILGRMPDAEGWHNWSRQVASGMTRHQLLRMFLGSPEYQSKNRLAAIERVETERFVLFVDMNDGAYAESISQSKVYEPHITDLLQSLLKPEHVFLDIGCNVGWFSLIAASILKKGKVIGVEPNQNNLQLLYRSMIENQFDNMVIYPYAATDRSRILQMSGYGPYAYVHSIFKDAGFTYVQGIAIDELVRDESRLDVIKMDIEGHEPVALQGMRRTIARYRPIIVSEFHPKAIREYSRQEPQDYLEALVSMGYSLSVVEPTGKVIDFIDPSEIMTHWRNLNLQFDSRDAMHLDILARPSNPTEHSL